MKSSIGGNLARGASFLALVAGATAALAQPQASDSAAPFDAAPAVSNPTEQAAPAAAADTSGDIVVTARRREESAQRVPVAITAFSAAKLENATVQSLQDLTALTPGLRFSSEGGGGVSSLSLRGLSKTPVGETLPAVVIYFAEVAMPNQGADLPTYDLGNVQVLKGPQGTLFGRNTLGGAILLTPQAPTFTLEGYAKGTVGNFDLFAVEGAVNVPLIDDKLAVRVAGQIRRRDGTIDNLSGGKDFNNIRQESARVSILAKPVEGITNTLVVDYFHANEIPNHAIAYRDQSAQFLPLLGPDYVRSIQQAVARQQAFGPFKAFQAIEDLYTRRESVGVVNTTRIDIADDVYFKNIFGYRHSTLKLTNPSDGFPPLAGPAGAPTLDLLTGGLFSKRNMLSNEMQLQGEAAGGVVDWIVGGIYTEDKPTGTPNGNFGSRFQIGGNPPPSTLAPALSSFIQSKSYAVFGQVGVDLSEWVLEGLKLNAGYRHSWDRVRACGTSNAAGFVSQSECERIAGLGLTDGTGIIRAKGNEPTYTIGVDYQATPDVMLYAAHRRGYRGVNVNSPLFESPFMTGGPIGTGCQVAGGPVACPDLRGFQTTRPEKLTDVEVGIKTNWRMGDARGRFNVAVYRSKLKDLVQFLNTGDIGVPARAPDRPQSGALGVNLADQTVTGVEVDGNIIPFDNFTLSFNGSYVDHKIDAVNFPNIGNFNFTPNTINRPTPKFSGTVAAEYVIPAAIMDGDLAFNVDFYHSTSYRPQTGVALDGYDLLNGRIDLRNIGGRGWDVGFWMKNITNAKYQNAPIVISPAFPLASALYGERRTFGLDVRVRFGQ
jgi:iron complex outermembrane receptor protein